MLRRGLSRACGSYWPRCSRASSGKLAANAICAEIRAKNTPYKIVLVPGQLVQTHRRLMQTPGRSLNTSSQASVGQRSVVTNSTRRHVRHILTANEDINLHEQLQRDLEGGGDFDGLARKHSICPSRQQGGVLGWIKQGLGLPATFEEAVFEADVGEVVTAETQKGLHIIQVLDESKEAEVQHLSVEQLSSLLQNEADVQLIDVREEHEHQTANLPNFKLLPLSRAQEWAPTLTTSFEKDKMTVCLCHHGVRSARMADMLLAQGFTNVHNVVGGIDAYSNIDGTVPRY